MSNNETESTQVELSFEQPSELILPSAKRSPLKTRRRKHLPWEANYAAFSLDFAASAINYLCESGAVSLYDPFVGCGTTLEAATRANIHAIGVDLNPYNALLSRCRVAFGATREKVDALLDRSVGKNINNENEDKEILPRGAESGVGTLVQLISERTGIVRNNILKALTCDDGGLYDDEVVALIGLLHACRQQANVHFRSNPAWLVKGSDADSLAFQGGRWLDLAKSIANTIIMDLNRRRPAKRSKIKIHIGSYEKATIEKGAIQRFLTSPPYLNRLDYVNPTLPQLKGLGLYEDSIIDEIRLGMMGTTKMRKKIPENIQFISPIVNDLLKTIADHHSKASATYYRRFYEQYFVDLENFLSWLDKYGAEECRGIMVIQDSYYKEINIPIDKIISEAAGELSFNVKILNKEVRTRHMGQISPYQRMHAPDKALTEYTLLLSRG